MEDVVVTVAWIVVGALALAFAASAVAARIPPLVRFLRRKVWTWQDAERRQVAQPPPADRRRRRRRWLRVAGAHALRAPLIPIVSLRLRIEDFAGKAKGKKASGDVVAIDGATVAAVVRVGMLRAAATGGSTPQFVSAPFSAGAALSDVASAVGDVSDRGKVAAAAARLLSLVARLLGRDELVLSGRLLSSTSRGPAVALLLASANGRIVDSRILWADTYEIEGATPDLDDPTDRLTRVAVAAAVWTQFTVLRSYGALVDADYERTVGTTEWESYAFHQIASLTKPAHATHDAAATCLFAHAVDRDPTNLHARFNMASGALGESGREGDAYEELTALHAEVEARARKQPGSLLDAAPTDDGPLYGFEAEDQFHFQVSFVRAVFALDRLLIHRRHVKGHGSAAVERRFLKDVERAWTDLTKDLLRLERALMRVDETVGTQWGARWASSLTLDSGEDIVRIDGFLRQLEGRMLPVWASMAFHLESAGMRQGSRTRVPDRRRVDVPCRAWLVEILGERASQEHDALVNRFLLRESTVWVDETTHYNVACYFADRNEDDDVRRELRRALATGHSHERALEDPQLHEYRPFVRELCEPPRHPHDHDGHFSREDGHRVRALLRRVGV